MIWVINHLGLLAGVAAAFGAVTAVAFAPLGFLREPAVVTRGYLLALALFIGLLGGGAILLGQAGLDQARLEGAHGRARDRALSAERDRSLRAEILSKRELRALARRQARLERPTEADILRLIRRASAVCARLPARCRAATPARSQLGTEPAPTGSAPGPTARAPSRRPARRPRPPEGPQTPPAQRPEPSPPPQPRPPIDLHTPPTGPLPAPTACLPPLLDLNCP